MSTRQKFQIYLFDLDIVLAAITNSMLILWGFLFMGHSFMVNGIYKYTVVAFLELFKACDVHWLSQITVFCSLQNSPIQIGTGMCVVLDKILPIPFSTLGLKFRKSEKLEGGWIECCCCPTFILCYPYGQMTKQPLLLLL